MRFEPIRVARVLFWTIFALGLLLATTSKGAEPPAWCVQIDVKDTYGSSHGSGSLVSPSLVLTNHHVVKERKSSAVKVWFPNGEVVDGKVIKVDQINDLAAIRVASSLRPYIKLGSNLRIGETLTLHGYAGKQKYRSDTGVVSKFESPTRNGPNTFVLVHGATARGQWRAAAGCKAFPGVGSLRRNAWAHLPQARRRDDQRPYGREVGNGCVPPGTDHEKHAVDRYGEGSSSASGDAQRPGHRAQVRGK